MIESHNPQINVDELMQKIMEEIAKRQANFQPNTTTTNLAAKSPINVNLSHIESLLINAESRACPRTNLPNKFNSFPFNISDKIKVFILKVFNLLFKDQREVNFNLIQSLRESVALNRQLMEEIAQLRFQLDERLNIVDGKVQAVDQRLNIVDGKVQAVDKCLGAVDARIRKIDDGFHAVNSSMINILDERLNNVDANVQALNHRYLINDSYIKNNLGQQKRLLTLFLEEARQRLPEPFTQEQLQTFVNENQHLLDAFYAAFEDEFRGSREEILSRLKVYLPLIEEAKIGTPDSPILDVGCGRGEWLELLRESGYTATGIDINRVMLEQCRFLGLEVIEADVIAYLQSLPENSVGAVTGFHIIEHLPFPILMRLLNETLRVLQPGGLAIFETPNPNHFMVSTHNFYLDPTHLKPLPIPLMRFLAESQGFCGIKIMELRPHPDVDSIFDKYREIMPEIAEIVSKHFYGAGDYAIVAYKKIL